MLAEFAARPMADTDVLLRLLTWFSPSFPVGGFSYSHGIENAVEAELIRDADSLGAWVEDALRFGGGRSDAILLGCAWHAEVAGDDARLAEILDWGDAFRGTAELALESAAQGKAFLAALRTGWPHPRLDALDALTRQRRRPPAYPVTAGVAAAVHGLQAAAVRLAFLHAFAANLVSAGVRLIPLGQSEGLRVLAALGSTVEAIAAADGLDVSDLGAAAWMIDCSSARHETQYTRLFRS